MNFKCPCNTGPKGPSPALPAPGHPAGDRLAPGSVPDGEAVRGPDSPRQDGSICERGWSFRLGMVIEEEQEEEEEEEEEEEKERKKEEKKKKKEKS